MFPEWIQIFLSSAPLAVMEDVQLCFLWRESRGRANSPCRRGLQGGRARSKMLAMIFPSAATALQPITCKRSTRIYLQL